MATTKTIPQAAESEIRKAEPLGPPPPPVRPPVPPSAAPHEDEPVTHLQRELYGIGRALCGAPRVTTEGRPHVPIDVAFANPEALMGRRLCGHCVGRFHRIRNM